MDDRPRYWEVTVIAGHFGAGNCNVTRTFGLIAKDAIEASKIAKRMPGVKHTRPVLRCYEIDECKYKEVCSKSAYEFMGVNPKAEEIQ